MHVLINGVRLFFDVEGAKLVPDGPAMREKPTLLLLHVMKYDLGRIWIVTCMLIHH